MEQGIELILLILTYTVLVIAIFISGICYRKKIEKVETIAFMVSLLLLAISFFFEQASQGSTTGIFTLIAMILVGLTTPLNVLAEREHNLPNYVRDFLFSIASMLFLLTVIGSFFSFTIYLEYAVAIFLVVAIALSMIMILLTKPRKEISHLEKSERIFSLAFLIIVPSSLYVNYFLEANNHTLQIGFALPIIFILLAVNKLYDDLKRLSLIQTNPEPLEQNFQNYHVSPREKEIAALLIKGKTYKAISEELFVSLPTVKTHASNIYKKCGAKNRHELMLLLTTKS